MREPLYDVGDQVQYRSPTDEHDVVGEIEVVILEVQVGNVKYGIWHPCYGYEIVDEIRISYKLDN